MGENYFPRGGNQTNSKAVKHSLEINEDLFHSAEDNKKKSADGKRSKKDQRDTSNNQIDDPSDLVAIEQLTQRKITEGLVILACVHEVHRYNVLFALPGGIIASVPITNMPDSYVDLLKRYSENSDNVPDELLSLSDVFQVGNCYPVKVTNCQEVQGTSSRRFTISVNPRIVNENLTKSSVYNGMVLFGAIASIEDHGFLVDVGIKGVTGFLSLKNANSSSQTLSIGQIIQVAVDMPELEDAPLESRSLKLTCKSKKIRDLPESLDSLTLQNILPGMSLPAEISKASKIGLLVTCLGYKGCIHKDDLENSFQNPTEYKTGQGIVATVLCVHPTTQTIHMTLVNKPTSKNIIKRFGDLKDGDLIPGAEIIEVTSTGVYFKLPGKFKGFATLSQLADHEIDNIKNYFQQGEKKKCRIIGFNYFNKIAKISLRASVLKKSIVNEKNLKVGDILDATVKDHTAKGMYVRFSDRVEGFVQSHHISDTLLYHPEKAYPVGSSVKCRVLALDQAGLSSHLITCKKTLVNSKTPPLTNLEDTFEGLIVEGVVKKASPMGLLIEFYNKIKGWVYPSMLSNTPIEHPEKVFHQGQVVKCKVLGIPQPPAPLKLTLRMTTMKPFGVKDMGKEHNISAGSVVSVEVVSKDAHGLDVIILPDGPKAYLPIMHLSDHPYASKIIFEVISLGHIFHKATVFSVKGILLISIKAVLLQAAANDKIPRNLKDLRVGQLLPGVIKGFLDIGIQVGVGNSLVGLIHKSKIMDGKTQTDPKSLGYVTQQTLMLKIMGIDFVKGQFYLTSRVSDVEALYKSWIHSLYHLESFLKDWDLIHSLISENLEEEWRNLQVGSLVHVKLTDVSSEELACKLKGLKSVEGILHKKNLDPSITVQVGEKLKAVVVHLDFEKNRVELVASPSLTKSLKRGLMPIVAQEEMNKITRLSGKIVCVTDHYAVLLPTDQTLVGLVHMPIRKHPNEINKLSLKIGESKSVLIQKALENPTRLLGVLLSEVGLQTHRSTDQLLLDVHTDHLTSPLNNMELPLQKLADYVKYSTFPKRVIKSKMFAHLLIAALESNGISSCTQDNLQSDSEKQLSIDELSKTTKIKRKRILTDNSTENGNDDISSEKTNKQRKTDPTGVPSLTGAVSNTSLSVGNELVGVIESIQKNKMLVSVNSEIIGYLRSHEFYHFRSLKEGSQVFVKVLSVGPKGVNFHLLKDLSEEKKFETQNPGTELQIGQTVLGKFYQVMGKKIFVSLGKNIFGVLSKKSRSIKQNFNEEEKLVVKITGKTKSEYILELLATDFEPTMMDSSVTEDMPKTAKTVTAEGLNMKAEFQIGQELSGEVSHFSDYKIFVRITDEIFGTIKKKGLVCDAPSLGSKVTVTVMNVSDSQLLLNLESIDKTPIEPSEAELQSVVIVHQQDIEEGSILTGRVTKIREHTIHVYLGGNILGTIQKKDLREELTVGSIVKVLVTKIKQTKPELKVAHLKFMEFLAEDESTARVYPDYFNVPITDDSAQKVNQKENTSEPARLSLSEPFVWDDSDALSKLEEINKNSIDESSEDSDDSDLEPTVDNRKKTKASREAHRKEQEARIRKQEERLMNLDREPESSDDFDRMLIASPNNSALWMKYMAFQLQQAEIEKARAVTERALRTISFREEREKLNIWVALLNLENMYGTQDTLNGVFQRALQFCEPIEVYRHMVNIYTGSKKNQEAEQTFQTMLKKFRQNPSVWLDFGVFYMTTGHPELARKLMDRSLQSLDKKHQVDIISKFGQLEFKFGDAERGKTLFNNILTTYPKRIDLWSVFIDILIKQKDVDAARQALEKLASMNLPAKKMKFVFKKYLEFEKDYGTDVNIEKIRLKALEYVNASAD